VAINYRAQSGRILAGRPQIEHLPEAQLQTFLEGELVYMNSGYLTVCGADPALILGLSLEDGHNDAADGSHSDDVLLASVNQEFIMQIGHSGGGDATNAVTDLMAAYGVTLTSNKWYVDKNKTGGDARVKVTRFLDPVGTTNGRVYVKVLAANRQVE